MENIILLNAPPRAGKDAIGKSICELKKDAKIYKFADILKNTSHTLAGLASTDPDMFEDCKDKPNVLLPKNTKTGDNFTPREWYVFVSEVMVKPNLGNDFWGKSLLTKLEIDKENKTAAITDSGFFEEAKVLMKHFGMKNCMLVEIHRKNHTFDKDSRSYWADGRENCDIPKLLHIDNNVEGEEALTNLAKKVLQYVK